MEPVGFVIILDELIDFLDGGFGMLLLDGGDQVLHFAPRHVEFLARGRRELFSGRGQKIVPDLFLSI